MNNFNVMIGFIPDENIHNIKQLTEEQQINFFSILETEFKGTELELGFKKNWFEEFTPNYCTNAANCGEKFFLLQSSGDIYSCVRGQSNPVFRYGNVFNSSIQDILLTAKNKIINQHQISSFDPKCKECGYLYMCHTGCPYVKNITKTSRSYTCKLQRKIYNLFPQKHPMVTNPKELNFYRNDYIANIHPYLINEKPEFQAELPSLITDELFDDKNALLQIISSDPILDTLYSDNNVLLILDHVSHKVKSQILKITRDIHTFSQDSIIKLYIHKGFFEANTHEIIRNKLALMLLSSNKVIYGDEQREKQEHVFDYFLYYNQLSEATIENNKYFCFDLDDFLKANRNLLDSKSINNLFITTSNLKAYHYEKQRKNAFYHIQAINLPFQNIEFYWND